MTSDATRRGIDLLSEGIDDVLAQILISLDISEINRVWIASSKRLKDSVWYSLCCFKRGVRCISGGKGKSSDDVWRNLPTRPRKSWAKIFFDLSRKHMQSEEQAFHTFASRVYRMLGKRDDKKSIEKLIRKEALIKSRDGHSEEWTWGRQGINRRVSAQGVVALMPVPRPDGIRSRGVDGLEGSTLLNIAVRREKFETVKLLVEVFGADVNIPDAGGFTPLMNASWHGDRNIAKFLLNNGADISARGCAAMPGSLVVNLEGPRTAEEWAARQGHTRLAAMIHEERLRTPIKLS